MKILIFLKLLILFVLIIFCPILYSDDQAFYAIHDEYVGVRPLAMGNAFVAVGGDYNSLFYNSAMLSDLKENRLNLSLLSLGTTVGKNSFLNLYEDVQKISDSSDTNSSTTEMASFISSRYGKSYYARLTPLSTFWSGPRKALAFIPIDFSLSLSIHQQVGPVIKLRAFQDTTLAFGYGREIPNIPELSIGMVAKIIYRSYFGKQIPALELVSNSKFIKASDAKEGRSLDFDLGALYKFPFDVKYRPQFGANLKNIWDVGFRKNYHLLGDKSERPPKLQRRLDVGMMVPLGEVAGFRPKVAMDIRNIGHNNWTFLKGFHLGTEWEWDYDWWLKGSLLAGLKQGYLTYGISLQGLWFLIEFVSYGNEIGTQNLRQHDRVYMGKMGFYF